MANTVGFSTYYFGTLSGTTFTVTSGPFSQVVYYTDQIGGNANNVAEPNETISSQFGTGWQAGVSIPPGDAFSEEYIGSSGGGIVTEDSGAFIFSTSNPRFVNLATGQTVEVTSANFLLCFTRGTAIATPNGERAVETLAIGNLVLNAQGQPVPVKWIGRQTIHPAFAMFHDKLPIRITAGALGQGLPHRDLCVSPDHALLVEGCLIHASALVNGRTITRATDWTDVVEYFHIETEAHEIILAEGAPTETFIDNVSRECFDNYAEYAALYPDAAPMVELDLPRVLFARQLPAVIRRHLDAVADAMHGVVAQVA